MYISLDKYSAHLLSMYPEHLFFVLCQTSSVIVSLSSFRFNENSCNSQLV